jgi:hypothetical protein
MLSALPQMQIKDAHATEAFNITKGLLFGVRGLLQPVS